MTIEKIPDMEVDVEKNVTDDQLSVKESILDSVAKGQGFFKSQQVGEKDLTFSEKRDIAADLLSKNVPLFLQRYWKFIKLEDTSYFDSLDCYEVKFYVDEIKKFRDPRKNKNSVKNRRFGALRKMIKEGAYFSDEEMKSRNPFMFDQFIGQHLSESERVAAYKSQHTDEKFSNFLLGQVERNYANTLYEQQKSTDEAIEEEEDDDDDKSVESDESELEDEPEQKQPVTPDEKSRLRSEFTNMMYESFMAGEDKEFDYSCVDYNEEFDPAEKDVDAEEKYFNEEV
ncbi:hypothetical protein JTE90_009097 [Oedothorax gibbosus]|uniref:CCD97-like C-terminal domain-containing protein n=1 Tax=Oedothorax gibbosus TaxID=931172 RepID=A0AAV6V1T6_9ARAC|nr:hypothetical protein JTE90_009097 [Oedothorax gibbosus]